ncbi:MAG TPA: flagellar protein FlgN [Candidatus Desulfobacillus sp.]|nr:flagellar protein FlgN [Candidatus Desulfobacillus sp.]
MSGNERPPTIGQLLGEEVAQLRGFLVLLGREERALIDGEVDCLPPIVDEKNALFAQLARLGESRGETLAAAGFAHGRQGMEAWLERHPDKADARRDWLELLALADKANGLNRSNGELIAMRLTGNQQALATLMTAANQGSLYGPDGQAKPLGGGRSLGSV